MQQIEYRHGKAKWAFSVHICAGKCCVCSPPGQGASVPAEGNHLLSWNMDFLMNAACGMLPRRIDTKPPFVITLDFFTLFHPGELAPLHPSSRARQIVFLPFRPVGELTPPHNPPSRARQFLFHCFTRGGSLSPPKNLPSRARRLMNRILLGFTVLSIKAVSYVYSNTYFTFLTGTHRKVCVNVERSSDKAAPCSTNESCH